MSKLSSLLKLSRRALGAMKNKAAPAVKKLSSNSTVKDVAIMVGTSLVIDAGVETLLDYWDEEAEDPSASSALRFLFMGPGSSAKGVEVWDLLACQYLALVTKPFANNGFNHLRRVFNTMSKDDRYPMSTLAGAEVYAAVAITATTLGLVEPADIVANAKGGASETGSDSSLEPGVSEP